MSVTSHDVARRAGVSQPTVSRALRGDSRVAAATREKVQQAAAELGYVASELGRSLATRTTRQIAMVADLDNALYPTLVGPLHDRFVEHGLRMVLLAERGDDRSTYERVLDRSVDGVVLTTTLVESSLSAELLRRGVPFVELNRLSGLPVDGVTADNVAGGAACARLLVEAGHRRIAAVFGTGVTSSVNDREAGFRAALTDLGVDLSDHRVTRGWFGVDDGDRAVPVLMTGRHKPTAVFCAGGDSVAVGVVNRALRTGFSVPGDLAVVGFDDLAIAAWPQFELTTVRVDLQAMALAAADRLVARLGGDESPASVEVFPVETVLRTSHRRA